jgi:hypothetical protein
MAHADQKPRNGRLGNVAALSRVTRQVAPNGSAAPDDAALNQRKLVADFCKLLAPRNG